VSNNVDRAKVQAEAHTTMWSPQSACSLGCPCHGQNKTHTGGVKKQCFGPRGGYFFRQCGRDCSSSSPLDAMALVWTYSKWAVGSTWQGADLLWEHLRRQSGRGVATHPTQRWPKGAKTGKQRVAVPHHGLATRLLTTCCELMLG